MIKKAKKKTSARVRQTPRAGKAEAKKPAKKALPKLTPKYETFAENVIANNGNATDAARKAGVEGTDGAVRVTAHRMLINANVQEYIQERTREKLKGVKADADELFYLLADHLRADIADFDGCFNDDGGLDLKKAKKRGVSHLLRKLKTRAIPTPNGQIIVTEIEIHDSQSAAGRLAELMGMKQAPRANQDDIARVNAELARLVGNGWEPEDARKIVLEAEPAAARWLN